MKVSIAIENLTLSSSGWALFSEPLSPINSGRPAALSLPSAFQRAILRWVCVSFKERGHSFMSGKNKERKKEKREKKGGGGGGCVLQRGLGLLCLRGWLSEGGVRGSQLLLPKEACGLHLWGGGGHVLFFCPFPLVSFSSPLFLVQYLILQPFED